MASPAAWTTEKAPPFLIVHGTRDTQVPYRHAELLAAALQQAGVDVHLLSFDADHLVLNQHRSEIMQAMLDFFDRQLGVPRANVLR
jgi:dipeptidyl aminopeptidase/acylaminoacyl peptidase